MQFQNIQSQGSASVFSKLLGYVTNWLHKVLLPENSVARPVIFAKISREI